MVEPGVELDGKTAANHAWGRRNSILVIPIPLFAPVTSQSLHAVSLNDNREAIAAGVTAAIGEAATHVRDLELKRGLKSVLHRLLGRDPSGPVSVESGRRQAEPVAKSGRVTVAL